MSRTTTFASLGILLTGIAIAQTARSGTEVGATLPGPFRVLVVTGPVPSATGDVVLPEDRRNLGDLGRVGKFHDFVTRWGLDPAVAVFSREAPPTADQPLGQLFQRLDAAVQGNRAARLHSYGTFLTLKGDFFSDPAQPAQVKQIQAFAEQAKLQNVPLGLDQVESDRTKAYGIGADQTLTILVYTNLTVTARFTFSAAKPLDEAGVQSVLAEVQKLVAKKK